MFSALFRSWAALLAVAIVAGFIAETDPAQLERDRWLLMVAGIAMFAAFSNFGGRSKQ